MENKTERKHLIWTLDMYIREFPHLMEFLKDVPIKEKTIEELTLLEDQAGNIINETARLNGWNGFEFV
jgi:hypothetical protein